jgi:outer membrane protein assembly factor BamB
MKFLILCIKLKKVTIVILKYDEKLVNLLKPNYCNFGKYLFLNKTLSSMKKVKFLFSIMIVVLLVLSSANTYSQDWPQWRGLTRDGKVAGLKAPSAWPKELTPVWKASVGLGDATPVLVGNRIYVFARKDADEVVQCLDVATGKEVWQYKYAATVVSGPSASQHPGPRSTPAVAGGKIVTFGVGGVLTCLDAATGKLVWKRENPTNAIPQFYTGTSPIIVDGMVITHVGSPGNGEIIALDITTGAEKWKWAGDGPSYASPSVMTVGGVKQLVAQTEKSLLGLNLATGKLLWQIATPIQQRFYNAVSPLINGQTVIYSGQGIGTKAITVEKQGEQFVTKEIWSNTEAGEKWNSPVLKDGFLYGVSDLKKIYCIDAATGKTAWIDAGTNSDFAAIVDCGTAIFALPSTGNLIVLTPNGKAYTEAARYKVTETATYSDPIISGNLVYIKDTDSLMQYKF